MFIETKDEDVFRKFWYDERFNSPRHFQDATSAWHTSWDDFKEFCDKCKVYCLDDSALVYVEKTGEIHLSVLRGTKPDMMPHLMNLRQYLLTDLEILWGWVSPRNRGLKRIMTELGFKYFGYNMLYGQSHGKVLEWHCYVLSRKDFFCKQRESLLNS